MTSGFRRKAAYVAAMLFMLAPMSAHARSLLLISIDGMSPDYAIRAEALGIALPNLKRFMVEGSYAQGVRGVVPTVTCPSHATLVTGVTPSRHGITGNDPLKADGYSAALCTFASDIKADTLWDLAARSGIETGSVGWLNTAGAATITYDLPHVEPYESAITLKFQEAMARPAGFLARLERDLGSYYQDATETGSDIRARFASEIMRRYKPGLMMVHLVAVDHASHGHGPWSAEARKAVEHEDALIGELVSVALANDPEAVIAVVSDHGQLPYTRVFNINIPLVEAGLIAIEPPAPGQAVKVRDWTARRWGDAILLKDPSDADARARVSQLLQRLAADPANGIDRIVEGSALETLGGYPGASFVIAMKPGTVLGGAYLGDRVATVQTAGTHGYLPDVAGMNAAFFIKGRGIKAGQNLGIVDMLRIAPTLAEILGGRLGDAHEVPLAVLDEAQPTSAHATRAITVPSR